METNRPLAVRIPKVKPFLTAAVALASAIGLSGEALAEVPIDKWLPKAEVDQHLAADGQEVVLSAEMPTEGTPLDSVSDVPRKAVFITMNKDGFGFLLEGDNSLGSPITSENIKARLTRFRAFDPAKPGLDPAAKIGGNPEAVEKECESIQGLCGYHDTVLETIAKEKGIKPLLQAVAFVTKPNGALDSRYLVTVLVKTNSEIGSSKFQAGGLAISYPDGLFVYKTGLGSVSPTPDLLHRFGIGK